MRTWQKITVAILAAAALSGCGKNPAAGPEGERVIKNNASVKRAASVARPTAKTASQTTKAPAKAATSTKAPGVSTKPGATTPGAATTPSAPTQPGSATAAQRDGALRLTIRTWGADPVGSLVLQVFSQVDPAQSAEVPLQLTGPEAQWEQADVPAGRYTIRVKALSTTGAPMGIASTEAIVEADAMTDLTIDLGVDSPAPTPTQNAGGQSGAAGGETTPTPTAAPTATPTAAPTGPGAGGTLGLRVEIL